MYHVLDYAIPWSDDEEDSEVYLIGVLAKTPFERVHFNAGWWKHCSTEDERELVREHNRTVPKRLDAMLEKCAKEGKMAKVPDQAFKTLHSEERLKVVVHNRHIKSLTNKKPRPKPKAKPTNKN